MYRVAIFMSKLHYIYSKCNIKLRYVYLNLANCFRFTCIYNSQMILHISIQFHNKYFTDFSRYIFHAVSISCKSAWPVPHLVSMTSSPTCEWTTLHNSNMAAEEGRIQRIVRGIVSSEISEPNLPTNVQIFQSNREAPVNTGGGFQNVNEELQCRFQIPRHFPANGDRECALSPLLAPNAERQAPQQSFKSVDGPAQLLQFARCSSLYSLALTSMSFRDFPLRYDSRGGSLKIFLNCGWFCIKCHLPMSVSFMSRNAGWYCVTKVEFSFVRFSSYLTATFFFQKIWFLRDVSPLLLLGNLYS